jgi:hypothetical protein
MRSEKKVSKRAHAGAKSPGAANAEEEDTITITKRKVAQHLGKLSDLRTDPITKPSAASCHKMTSLID